MNLKVINMDKINMKIILVKKTTKNTMLDGEVNYNSILLLLLLLFTAIGCSPGGSSPYTVHTIQMDI
jgi:hypothetical protein